MALPVKLSVPPNAVAVSPFTNPAYWTVKAGVTVPYAFVLLSAVTVRAAGVICSVPLAKLMA